MWGLDAADPRVAIEAMQAMNASVRNPVFAPAFFGTPVVLGVTALVLWRQSLHRSGLLFGASALVYVALGLLLTMFINVPMNQVLGAIDVPQNLSDAQAIWDDYSPTWQFWNQVRTVTSGISFILAVLGVLAVINPTHQPKAA